MPKQNQTLHGFNWNQQIPLMSHHYLMIPLTHKHKHTHTRANSTFQLFLVLFDLGAWRNGAPPFGGSSALSFRNQGAGTDPHSHHTSESLSCLLNTDTNPQTHTHTQAACHANHHCTDGLSTEDTLSLWLVHQQPPFFPYLQAVPKYRSQSNQSGFILFRRVSESWAALKCTKALIHQHFPAGWRSEEGVDPQLKDLGSKPLAYIKVKTSLMTSICFHWARHWIQAAAPIMPLLHTCFPLVQKEDFPIMINNVPNQY